MASIYTFSPEDAERFATFMGAKTRHRVDELEFVWCPYCQGGGHDKGTFSINLSTGQFKCQRASCSVQGNMITLARDFGFSLGRDTDIYYGIKWQQFVKFTKKPETIEIRDAAVAYLEGRGISREVVERYHITAQKDDDSILVFPFIDDQHEMRFIKFRNTAFQKGMNGSKEWCKSGCMPILFGMDQCNPENKTLIMTEGQIDSLSVATAGIENAVSVPTGKNGFTWVPHCWNWLQSFEKLIVFGDLENGGITLLPEMKARFNGLVLHVRPEDYQGCKDANEILMKYGKDAIKACIDNAEADPDVHLVRMADVEAIDLLNMPHISTGLSKLDKLIGGFYFGQVILLTGRRGKGKSTLASQFLCRALMAGESCLAYSGELPHPHFREWMDRQLAGPELLNPVTSDNGKADWTLQDWQRKRLHDWYYNSMWLYDDVIVENETESLLDVVEKAVRENGIRVVLLDNLMTAIEENLSADLNRLQSAFVRRLAQIARTYKVVILLVAHPRKRSNNGKTSFDADDVMGSGNITNAVDVVLEYDEGPEKFDRPPRVLTVHKNRLTGELGDSIALWYNPESKRISETKGFFAWADDKSGPWSTPYSEQMQIVHDPDLPWDDEEGGTGNETASPP